MKRLVCLCLACAAALLAVGMAAAASEAAPSPSPVGERVSLNFPAIPLGTFLKAVSEASGLKLVAGPGLSERVVSVYLTDVTPEEALAAVCDAQDLFVDRSAPNGIIVIREFDGRFIPLEHLDAESVQAVVSALAGRGATVSVDKAHNALAVQGSPRGLDRVVRTVGQMDRRPEQVLIEAVLVEMSDDAQRQIGLRWEPSAIARGAVRKTRFPFTTGDRRLMVTEEEDPNAITFGLVNFQDFLVDLKFLERDGKVNILASPRIAALHGKEAEIKIITNTVIATRLTRESEDLNLVTEEPVYAEIGVTLKTTPRVHADGKMTLSVEPTVSTAARAAFFEQAVDTFERSARTTVLVDSGATLAIGGLLRTEGRDTVRGFPHLGRLPVIGYLFGQRDKVQAKTDLVIFLNPRLQRPDGADAD